MKRGKEFPWVEPNMVDGEGNKFKLTVHQLFDVMAGANLYHERAKFLFARRHDLDPEAVHTALQRGREAEERGSVYSNIDFLLWKFYNKEIENNGGDVRTYVRAQIENPRELDTEMMRYARDDWNKPKEYQTDKFLDLVEGITTAPVTR